MGTRIRFPWMVPPRIGHPLLFSRPILEGNPIGPHSGPGPTSLNGDYDSTHRSIDSGVPFGKGTRLFLRAVSVRNGCAHAGRGSRKKLYQAASFSSVRPRSCQRFGV